MRNRGSVDHVTQALARQAEVAASIIKRSEPLMASMRRQQQIINPNLVQFLESAKIQQKIIAESILSQSQVPLTLNRQIARMLASPAIDVANRAFLSSTWVARFAHINAQFNARISQLVPRMTSVILPQLSPIIDLVKRVGEASSIRDAFQHYKLWIAPSMSEELIGNVLDAHSRGINSGTVHSMLVRYYARNNWKTLDEVVAGCKSNPLFKKRIKFIEEALETHRSGWYGSSVSLLLMQIEGIAADYVKKHKLMPQLGGKTREIILTAVKSTPCSLSDVREYAGISALVGYLEHSMYIAMDFDKEHHRLQAEQHLLAHPIRHGRQVKFDSRANSLRVFLILDVLSLLK